MNLKFERNFGVNAEKVVFNDYVLKNNEENFFESDEENLFDIGLKPKDVDFSSLDFLSRNNSFKRELKQGVSRFHHKDIDFMIYRNGENYQSQLVAPDDADLDELKKEFANLPLISNIQTKTIATKDSYGINGEIDEVVSQGNTGDCWMISAILSLNSSDKGKEIIKNAITVNDDGSATVNFSGLNVSYNITPEEILAHDSDYITYDAYSNGDNDMLVFELATEKLLSDINSGKVHINSDNEDITYAGEGNGIDDGGLPIQMIYYLTGVEADEYYNNNLSSLSYGQINSILKDALNNNKTLNFCLYDNIHSAYLTDGSKFSIDLGNGGHAFAITGITSDTVTFVNPWDSSVEYEMSYYEFSKLQIGYMSSADLSSINFIQEEINEDVIYEDDVVIQEDDIFDEINNFIPDFKFMKFNNHRKHKKDMQNYKHGFNFINDFGLDYMFKFNNRENHFKYDNRKIRGF